MQYLALDRNSAQEFAQQTGTTVLTPFNDCKLPTHAEDTLTASVSREGHSDGSIFIDNQSTKQDGEKTAEVRLVDIELLARVVYEHQRYDAARGFSDSQLDVLRAIEFDSADRVLAGDILDSDYTDGLSESTVYNCLSELRDKRLIEKVGRGVYRYNGP